MTVSWIGSLLMTTVTCSYSTRPCLENHHCKFVTLQSSPTYCQCHQCGYWMVIISGRCLYSSCTKESANVYPSYGWYRIGDMVQKLKKMIDNKHNHMWSPQTFFWPDHDSTLHETPEESKSKKIIDVLSFVRSVLASLNKKLAIFSAEFSSLECLSLACQAEKFRDILGRIGRERKKNKSTENKINPQSDRKRTLNHVKI